MSRRRGIDLFIKSPKPERPLVPWAYAGPSGSDRMVRHYLAGSGFNLLEGAAFRRRLCRRDRDYDRFFKPVSSPKWRCPREILARLPARPESESENLDEEMSRAEGSLYDALGGEGGNVYLGDGLWLGPGDSWHNLGR